MADFDSSLSSEARKYVNLSGLQTFYDELKKNISADAELDLNSNHPIQNSAVATYLALNQGNVNTLSSTVTATSAELDRFEEEVSGQHITIATALNDLNSRVTTIEDKIEGLDGGDLTVNTVNAISGNISYLTALSSYNNLQSGVSSINTYLSGKYVSAENLNVETIITPNISATSITALTASGDLATFTNTSSENISSTNAEITNLSSTSAKINDLSSTNAEITNLSSTSAQINDLSSTNISATSAILDNISSTYITSNEISAETITANLSGLAGSATKLSTARDISITGDEIEWTVSFDGSQNVDSSGHIKKVYWDALSGNAVGSGDTAKTSGIMTPDQINSLIDSKVDIAVGGVYQVKGNADWSVLSSFPASACHNGYVYNISDEPPESAEDHNGQRIFQGDNVVWVSSYDGTNKWDKLANTMEMTGKLDTTAFTAWSADRFDGLSANWSKLTTSASLAYTTQYVGDQSSADVIGSANSGAAASAWLNSNAHNYVSAINIGNTKNATVTTASATTGSATKYTLNVSSYKTVINTTPDFLSGAETDAFTSAFGLTQTAVDYMNEGHSAWSAVSSLINDDVISARQFLASDGFSGTNISGENSTSTIDNLIGSAQSGNSAYNWITSNSASMGLEPYTSAEILNGIKW